MFAPYVEYLMLALTVLGFVVWIRIGIKKPLFRDYAIATASIYASVVLFVALIIIRMRFPDKLSLSTFHVWVQSIWLFILIMILGTGLCILKEKPPRNGKEYIEEVIHKFDIEDNKDA